MANKMLLTNGERLGVRDPAAIQKADTFLRVLNSKPSSKTISDTAKIVLCLDLAASNLGVTFDKETALKLTGLRKTVYQNSLNNVEKILNLDKPVTVNELCVQFGCSEAKDTALRILESYGEKDTKIKDMGHPQYVAAAVYTSCKLTGIKVDKSQLKLISRLKMQQWNELLHEFSKFASTLGLSTGKKTKKSRVEEVEPMIQDTPAPSKIKMEEIEEYDVWRERILREATNEIIQREVEGYN